MNASRRCSRRCGMLPLGTTLRGNWQQPRSAALILWSRRHFARSVRVFHASCRSAVPSLAVPVHRSSAPLIAPLGRRDRLLVPPRPRLQRAHRHRRRRRRRLSQRPAPIVDVNGCLSFSQPCRTTSSRRVSSPALPRFRQHRRRRWHCVCCWSPHRPTPPPMLATAAVAAAKN